MANTLAVADIDEMERRFLAGETIRHVAIALGISKVTVSRYKAHFLASQQQAAPPRLRDVALRINRPGRRGSYQPRRATARNPND